jgi:hypothetical protein
MTGSSWEHGGRERWAGVLLSIRKFNREIHPKNTLKPPGLLTQNQSHCAQRNFHCEYLAHMSQ